MQRKIKRKFVSLILAASLAVSSLATFPMNVFAGTGKNGVIKAPKTKKVTGILFSGCPTNNIINIGKKYTLTAIFLPPDAYANYKTVEWSSSNTDVATVDSDGNVTAKAPGTVTITATAKNGSETPTDWETQSVDITVRPEATSITLNKSVLALNSDDVESGVHEETLQATVLPPEADQTVTWSSDKPDVAEVDENGTVTAKAPGKATITATTAYGFSATCQVFVDMVVVKADQTPYWDRYIQDDIVVDPVKLTFSTTYANAHDKDGWYRSDELGSFTLTVKPADDSNITIHECIFYHESIGRSSTSTDPPFSCEAFKSGLCYGINRVDVYFTRNANNG